MFGTVCTKCHRAYSADWKKGPCPFCEVERLQKEHRKDAAEFNRGCDAALAGGPPVEPDDCPYDSWKCGYAWGYWMRHPELGQAAAEAAGGED